VARKQRSVAYNRYGIVDRVAVAVVVKELRQAAGNLQKLAELGGLDKGQLSRLANGQMRELEPATYKALYRICGLATDAMVERGELSTDARIRIKTMWESWLKAAVCEPAGGQSNTPRKPRGFAHNRYGIVDRKALAAVVNELQRAAGGIRELGRLGGMNKGQLSRLKRQQAHELEPATFRALYRLCALAAKDRLAKVVDWKDRLDAAVLRPVGWPDPPRPDTVRVTRPELARELEVTELEEQPELLPFLSSVKHNPMVPITDGWPCNKWVKVSKREAAVLRDAADKQTPEVREVEKLKAEARKQIAKAREDEDAVLMAAAREQMDQALEAEKLLDRPKIADLFVTNEGEEYRVMLWDFDTWPRDEWVQVTKQVAEKLGARGLITMSPKAGEVGKHYVLYLESLGLPRPT